MATQNELDKRLVASLLQVEFEINQQLDVLSSDLQKSLRGASKGDKVVQVKRFETQSAAIIDAYFDQYASLVAGTSGAVASYKGAQAVETLKPILAKFGYTNTLKRMIDKQADYDVYYEALMKKRRVAEFGNYTFTERIKTLKLGTTKVVRTIVQNEVAAGSSVRDIAKKIDAYVKPVGKTQVSPFDVIRTKLGRPPTYKVKGVPAGSVQYNTIRIARTETAYTYRQATVDYYKDEPFVKAMKWVLSNRHDEVDICNDWAEKTYKADGSDLPSGHPNCVCDTQAVLLSQKEMKALGLD